MTERLPATPAPGPLEDFAQHFDGLFGKRNQREGFRRYLEGLLQPTERNKTLTGLANAEPGVGALHAAAQQLQWFLSESTWDPGLWWALEAEGGPYGVEQAERLVIATTDPAELPESTTWYLVTNLPAPGSRRAEESALEPAQLAEWCGSTAYGCGWSKATSRSSRVWAGPSIRCARIWPSGGTGSWLVVLSPSAGGPSTKRMGQL